MSRDDDWSDPTVVEIPDRTRVGSKGNPDGFVPQLTNALFGSQAAAESQAAAHRIQRRARYMADLKVIQQTAITAAICALCFQVVLILPMLLMGLYAGWWFQ